jgi:hypothetical protein
LTRASADLVAAAMTIKASRGPYVAAVVELISGANDAIIAVRDRGLTRITNYLNKQADKLDQEAREKAAAVVADPAAPELLATWPKVPDADR